MKSILLACSLLTSATLATAMPAVTGAGVSQQAADTLITLTEAELQQAVERVAKARLEAERQQVAPVTQEYQLLQSGLTAENLRLIKLQMLLQALGLTPGLAPQQVGNHVQAPTLVPYGMPQALGQQSQQNPRLDRLEQLMLLLLQQRQNDRDPVTLSSRTSGTKAVATTPAQQSNDSLLRVLQQELIALRASQPQQVSQPQVVIQQVPQLQQQLAAEVRTELRTDTVLRTIGFKRQVFFAVGQSKLLPEARLTLNEAYRLLSEDPALQLVLTGYASPEGNAKRNAQLAQERSQAVLGYLIACGVSADRLQVVSGGVDHQTDLRGVARRVDLELRK